MTQRAKEKNLKKGVNNMKLLTQEIRKKLSALYSQDDVANPICSLKWFSPDSSFTWFILEGSEQEDGERPYGFWY